VQFWVYLLTAILGYLLGSLPTGFLIARASGVDIREAGSGNIGATNVLRTVGKVPGVIVLLIDALKGFAGAAWVPILVTWILAPTGGKPLPEVLLILGGVASILGHNYTLWLGFKGGKGVATTAGALAALMPMTLLISLVVWMLSFVISRYVSLASVIAAASLPVTTGLLGRSNWMLAFATVMGAMSIWKHRSNIQRLLNGTESRFGRQNETRLPPENRS